MAQKSHGIKQLLEAEKRAAKLISDARNLRTRRLKEAKDEAAAEIAQLSSEMEAEFKSKESAEMEYAEFERIIRNDTDKKLSEMASKVELNKNEVVDRMLDLVYDVSPELHQNFRCN